MDARLSSLSRLVLLAGLVCGPAFVTITSAADDLSAVEGSDADSTASAPIHDQGARTADATPADLAPAGSAVVQTGFMARHRYCHQCRMAYSSCPHGTGNWSGSGNCYGNCYGPVYQAGVPGAYYGGWRDPRDQYAYSAVGYGVPVSVPLAPCVARAYNYGWGLPASRLTPVGATYNRWYPQSWYSFGYGSPAYVGPGGVPHPPVIYSPTDTAQSGFYYRHVPCWQPRY